mgnify:CR=1 FL=1
MSIKTGHIFPKNKVLEYMKYNSDKELMYLCFIKANNSRQIREYRSVPIEVAYKLFYCTSAADVINTFNETIKNKYEVLSVA